MVADEEAMDGISLLESDADMVCVGSCFFVKKILNLFYVHIECFIIPVCPVMMGEQIVSLLQAG